MPNWAIGLCALLIVVNLTVTIGIALSHTYETSQKLMQIVLVWLVPGIGAVVCWGVLREEKHTFRSISGSHEDTSNGYDSASGYDDGHHHGDGGGHDSGAGHGH